MCTIQRPALLRILTQTMLCECMLCENGWPSPTPCWKSLHRHSTLTVRASLGSVDAWRFSVILHVCVFCVSLFVLLQDTARMSASFCIWPSRRALAEVLFLAESLGPPL